jgi:hypothetical protein
MSRGWWLTSIPRAQKAPITPGWDKLRLLPGDIPRAFGNGENVGLILGSKSGWVTDGDLDCSEALILADVYLPITEAVFGRPSKPRSHRLYIAVNATYEVFADPIDGKTLLELRTDGRDGGAHQTVLPPSIHPSGEQIAWDGDIIAPAVIDARILRRRCAWLAIACLTMRYVSEHAAQRPGPDLPRVLWEFDNELGRRAFQWLGEPLPDAPQHNLRHRSGLTARELNLAEIVAAIPNNCCWEEWNKIGMAIFAATAGSDRGRIIFDDFSARSAKYNPDTTADRWRHYHKHPPSRIGAGSLVFLARQAGWRPKKEGAE